MRTHILILRLDFLTTFARAWLISFNLGSASATVASATAVPAASATAVPAASATAVPAASATAVPAASATAPSLTFSEASSGMRGCNPYNR
ncbi:uncharacterized protein BDCG_17302 [Blastomyces dermatitidis ER-3]|uniref:Secreted protein n=1 Tax=Ajellomyces dermatitidis (strain ER-3 / ATCC MYA-2586) TaxID=559297 RepID=A0ABX2VXS5_AJEDR|nr:uncharacterized protein BDCG_17302 [Blastomyces dermatitidis ER-3]OAT01945.1 hypothetical protein BDCG_17302 [Blastomyces dermatitidis ER-3]